MVTEMINSIRHLDHLAINDSFYRQMVSEVSIDLGGPTQPYDECLRYITTVALEVGEDIVIEEINHSIKLKKG